jgi:hypothetical protein
VAACQAPESYCFGACVDLQGDHNNCGACGKTCTTIQTCVSGVCECAGSHVLCSGVCTSTKSDPLNCGACGTKCATGQSCSNGICI